MEVTEYVLGLCGLVIKYIEPDEAIKVINAMSNRLADFEIWQNDFVDRYHRDPTADEVVDGFAAERWPQWMVRQMRGDLDRALGRVPIGGSGG